ncbi:MAG TPA: hypothetical protein DCL77_03920 [Prolixibacteraceae bacterium]|jgi:hypothetical protein|nr:hypothetical protein [Prolixibacteraceae bacterium]
MICIFEISSSEAPNFKRLIHINPEQTFEDFHQVIQRTCNFDHSQLASFFLADDLWRKKIEISSLDSGKSSPTLRCMRTTKLNEYLTEIGQRLMYVFDYFNDRFLYIELKDIIMKTDLKEPFVAYENGKSPSQFLINDYNDDVDVLSADESYKSFGDLEDYYLIFGEMDA